LPVLHFALLKYSRHVAAYILQKGVQVMMCICCNSNRRVLLAIVYVV
jgi:hypothetical protein